MILTNKTLLFVIGSFVLSVIMIGFILNEVKQPKHISKNEIINLFNANFDKFETVKEFISEETLGYRFYTQGRKKELLFLDNAKEVEVDKITQGHLIYIINYLDFFRIYESSTGIHFEKNRANKGLDEGIIYLKDNDTSSLSAAYVETQKIKNYWYYYARHTIVGM